MTINNEQPDNRVATPGHINDTIMETLPMESGPDNQTHKIDQK